MKPTLLPFLIAICLITKVAAGVIENPPKSVEKVNVIFSNHLDVGFTNLTVHVINLYFDQYFPRAIRTAESLNHVEDTRFIYTTHGWLISLYLDCSSIEPIWPSLHCPNHTMRQKVVDAINKGYITWHAFPFNSQIEVMMDSSMVHAAIELTRDLDDKFAKEHKITMTQRDVPGTTRSLIPLLIDKGVRALSIGVNGASSPPAVPKLFWWKDPNTNTKLLTTYHNGGYGGLSRDDCLIVDFNDRTEALCFNFRGDNEGPAERDEVLQNYKELRANFPEASTIQASTFDDFMSKIIKEKGEDDLPIVQSEIGDTWVYGVPSDPFKNQLHREVIRIRKECLKRGECNVNDSEMKRFDRFLLKISEHTWGIDTKRGVHDYKNWDNQSFQKVIQSPNFQLQIQSWYEQRNYFDMAFSMVKHKYKRFSDEIQSALSHFRVIHTPSLEGYTEIQEKSQIFNLTVGSERIQIAFNDHGAISTLNVLNSQKIYASAEHQIGLFQYQTFDATDFDHFLKSYMYCNLTECGIWALPDYAKPGINQTSAAKHGNYLPILKSLYRYTASDSLNQFLLELEMPHDTIINAGSPKEIWIHIDLEPNDHLAIHFTVYLFNKTCTRLPESMWFTFNPLVQEPDKGYWMDKLGGKISPLDIVRNGSFHQHAINEAVGYHAPDGEQQKSFKVNSLDVPVVVFGDLDAFPVPLSKKPSMTQGFHFNIYNNLWGTNYVMWYPFDDNDKSFFQRFTMHIEK